MVETIEPTLLPTEVDQTEELQRIIDDIHDAVLRPLNTVGISNPNSLSLVDPSDRSVLQIIFLTDTSPEAKLQGVSLEYDVWDESEGRFVGCENFTVLPDRFEYSVTGHVADAAEILDSEEDSGPKKTAEAIKKTRERVDKFIGPIKAKQLEAYDAELSYA